MNWREQVAQLEHEGNFDIAVFLLEKVIKENPEEMDAYIWLLYRFMDSFLENTCYWANSKDSLKEIKEEYCEAKIWHDYRQRAQQCFDDSYAKFSSDPAFLYYVPKILLHAYDFMGLKIKESLLIEMSHKAKEFGYNQYLTERHPNDRDDVAWAKRIINDPSIQEQLATKGAAGHYVLGGKIAWAEKILHKANAGDR